MEELTRFVIPDIARIIQAYYEFVGTSDLNPTKFSAQSLVSPRPGVVVMSHDYETYTWQLNTRKITSLQDDYLTYSIAQYCNDQVIIGVVDGKMLVYNIDTRQVVDTFHVEDTEEKDELSGVSSPIMAIAVTPKFIIAALYGRYIQVWTKSGTLYKQYSTNSVLIDNIQSLSDDEFAVINSNNTTEIIIYNFQTDQTVVLGGHARRVNSITFDAYTNTLISGSYDKTIRLWNIQSKACTIWQTPDVITALAVIPGTNKLASGSTDGIIRIWDRSDATHSIIQNDGGEIKCLLGLDDGTLMSSDTTNVIRWV